MYVVKSAIRWKTKMLRETKQYKVTGMAYVCITVSKIEDMLDESCASRTRMVVGSTGKVSSIHPLIQRALTRGCRWDNTCPLRLCDWRLRFVFDVTRSSWWSASERTTDHGVVALRSAFRLFVCFRRQQSVLIWCGDGDLATLATGQVTERWPQRHAETAMHLRYPFRYIVHIDHPSFMDEGALHPPRPNAECYLPKVVTSSHVRVAKRD